MNGNRTAVTTEHLLPASKSVGDRWRGALWLVPGIALSLVGCASHAAEPQTPPSGASAETPITRAEIEGAQRSWCDALLGIGASPEPRKEAERVLDSAYNYSSQPVLFKPTLTHGKQTFRFDRQGALAYFAGGDPAYPDDAGFALKGWKTCRPEVRETFTRGSVALAMGNVYVTDAQGAEVMVDKTFGYVRDGGSLKIVLHHSSLPYTREK